MEAIMSKQNNELQSMKPPELVELSGRQLDNIAGGMTKTVDAASLTLFQLCSQGKHLGSGKLH
jgi:type VI protein secretion system component Hcp